MNDEMNIWETEKAVAFLRRIGIGSGQTVLDFGARVGHYSVPAAIAVGSMGLVYAVDKDQDALRELERKASDLNLENIETMQTEGEVALDLKSESIDVALAYDVLHYFKRDVRTVFYTELLRLLRPGSLFSVYPKHVLKDDPRGEFSELDVNGVKEEIQDTRFSYRDECWTLVSHDEGFNKGCILNFRKPANE